jgi:hypothetical protein
MRCAIAVLIAGCGFHGPLAPDATAPGDALADGSALVEGVEIPAPFALTGARWLLPCTPGTDHMPNNTACHCADGSQDVHVTVGGAGQWHVMARIRGVMEWMGYTGGSASGNWYVGGQPGDGADNYYELAIDMPAQHYYINVGNSNVGHSWSYDEMVTFDVAAGATLTFSANGQDRIQWMGVDGAGQPISITGITDPPQPYDGQFARLDVLAAEPF